MCIRDRKNAFIQEEKFVELMSIWISPGFSSSMQGGFTLLSPPTCDVSFPYPLHGTTAAYKLQDKALAKLKKFLKENQTKVVMFGAGSPAPLLLMEPAAAVQAMVWITEHNTISLMHMMTFARNEARLKFAELNQGGQTQPPQVKPIAAKCECPPLNWDLEFGSEVVIGKENSKELNSSTTATTKASSMEEFLSKFATSMGRAAGNDVTIAEVLNTHVREMTNLADRILSLENDVLPELVYNPSLEGSGVGSGGLSTDDGPVENLDDALRVGRGVAQLTVQATRVLSDLVYSFNDLYRTVQGIKEKYTTHHGDFPIVTKSPKFDSTDYKGEIDLFKLYTTTPLPAFQQREEERKLRVDAVLEADPLTLIIIAFVLIAALIIWLTVISIILTFKIKFLTRKIRKSCQPDLRSQMAKYQAPQRPQNLNTSIPSTGCRLRALGFSDGLSY